jgi:glycosyltransferase involved in cell wall biosynthesis
LVYTLACVIAARLSGHEIYVQHHSFSPINRASHLMRLFVLFGGPHTCHVFLCGLMQRRFVERYPRARSYLISSNARYTPPQPRRVGENAPLIRIGLLSQLNNDKGLYRFLEVLAACRQKNLPVMGLLAGPLDEPADREKVAAAEKLAGGRLTYLGPLYGADQKKFYDEIDVFVFPTTYVNEAQPNVLFEAMSYGAAIISNVRGCISEDVTPDCGLLIQRHEEFVTLAVAQLEEWCRFPEQLRQAKAASATRLTALHNAANVDYFHMLSRIAGVRFESPKQAGEGLRDTGTISA